MVQKDKGGPGALSPAQRKRDKLPCLAMSKENFRLPVCLRRAGLKTVNGLAVPVKRMPLDLNLGAEKLDICGSDSAADVSAVGRGLPSSELGFKGSSTESSAGIAVDAASGRAVQSAKSKRVVQKRGVRCNGTLLAVAHCAARRTNRVGSHLRLAPQQRRWKWLEVQESFEHGPVEPERLHITIETVASSRAQ